MNHLRPFLQKTLPTSLVPLLLSGSFYLFGGTIPRALSGAYDGYFQFMFTMMAINIILKAFSISSNAALKKLKTSSDLFQTEELSRADLLKDAISTVLHYTVAYGVYCAFGLYISSLSCGSVIQCLGLPQNEVALPSDILLNQENLPLVRLLEGDVEGEEEKEVNSVYFGEGLTAPHKDELKSLSVSVGKVLGSLNIDVYSIVISADETLAYALARDSGALKIISISNLREPVLIASLALSKPSFNFFHRYLKLSHDGATLFASSFQLLEIIDVSESEAPRLLSRIKDENLQDSEAKYDIDLRNYRISMALSLNQETLYVAGLGLQIFNVADLSAPVLVHSATKEPETIYDLAISSLALSEDGETLFYANGALTIYSTETPHDLKVLKTFFAPDSSHYSIALSSDSQALYVTGSEYNGAVLQIVDVSKPSEPALLKTFELNLGEKSYGWPLIMGVNPEGTHVFLEMNNNDYSTNLNVFNLITGKQLSDRKSLIPEASSVVFLRDYNKIIAAANNQFLALGLYLNYPNSRTFSLSNNTVTTFSTSGKADSFVLSPDGKTLFILQSNTYSTSEENAFLEVFDLTDPSKPRKISTTAMPKGASSLQISLSSKKAFIALDTMFEIYDISDLTSIQPEKNIDLGAFRIVEEFIMSSDGKTGYVLQQINPEHVTLKIFDFITRKEIPNNILPQGGLGCKMVLSRDNNNLFLMKDELSIYDVSDLSKISKITSVSLPLTDADPLVEAFAISPDNKILYFTTFESGNMNKLRAFDIQVLAAPVELTEFLLPHFEFESASIKPVVSADSKKISIVQSQGILELDVSSPSSPKIIGVIPVSTTDEISAIKQFVISPDGKFGFITTQKKNEVRVLNLQQKHSLFFAQESFPLGQKISDSIVVFAFDEIEHVYLPMDQEDYKFIKNSLYSIHIDPTKPMTQNTLSPLPSWIVVDRESSIVTIEPKRSRDIGSFTIYSALSKKLTLDSFKKIEMGNLNSEDLVILLISLGYLDSQLFLTANFGAYKDFLLTSQFTPYKTQIYSFLKQHLIETCTTLDVAPSLNVISTERLFIFTPSYNAVKVDITLKGDAKPKFLRRTFGSLEPIILDDKSRIILEGPLKDVDQAIQQLVIDLDNTGACDGVITVNDNLNPIVTRSIANLCSYFRINIVPYASLDEELTLQNQIDRINIQTGKYFEIAIHNETFIDENNGPLSYALTMQDTKKPLPNWISIEGHVLKGTPPEELFGRSLGLILHVSNEFKVLRVHFRIGADISGAFLFKILLKLSPYLLTALGLWVSANKIYNVVYKDEYKNGKQFLVGVGEEINSSVIFPIYFVLEEKGEAELILRHLMDKVSKDVHKRSISNYEFAKHFFVNDELNKVEILRTINEVVSNLSEKEQSGLKIYTQGAASRKLVVTQLVINQLVDYLLASNRLKETKASFEKIKSRWPEMIEWNSSQLFVCSDLKLENIIGDGGSGSDANQRLLGNNGNVNKDLLKNAIASHAFECQSLETLAIRVHILAKEKVGNDQIKGYLKLDLEEINFNERGRADYGVDYKIKNSALCFSGTVQEDFKGKTMVIQLTNLKQKILKEVWISEDASKSGFTISEFIPSHQEQVQKGQGYEIY